MYCESCQTLFEERRCPECHRHTVREPRAEDPCFLAEKDTIWGEMLADVLRQNGIPYSIKRTLGAGLAMSVGAMLERYRFFVPYEDLPRAQALVDELFGAETDGEQ